MIARGKRSDGFGKFFTEGGAVGGGTEADHCVDRERGQTLVQFFGAAQQAADFANDARGKSDQVAGGESIGVAVGIDADGTHRGGRDHIGRCRGDEQALNQATPVALFGDGDQAVSFEGAEVVVNFLAGNSQLRSEHGGGGRLGEMREDPRADRIERDGGCGGIVDDFNGKHEGD